METERPDAIFRDPFARRLAGEKGWAIVRGLPGGRRMAWPMVVRTAVMDEIIMREVRTGLDQVLNLAAGLDARPGGCRCRPRSTGWMWISPQSSITSSLRWPRKSPVCRYEAGAAGPLR